MRKREESVSNTEQKFATRCADRWGVTIKFSAEVCALNTERFAKPVVTRDVLTKLKEEEFVGVMVPTRPPRIVPKRDVPILP